MRFCHRLMMAEIFLSPGYLLYLTMLHVLPQVASQVQFTSQYNGSVVFGYLGASVNFTWTFTGDLRVATWGTKRSDGFAINDKLLVSLNKNGSLQLVLPPRYKGRVKGSWDGKSPGRLTFTLTSIQEDDNIILLCKISPVKIHFSSVIDKVQLIVRVPPTASSTPKVIYVNVGDSATFTCIATGIPTPNITWYRSGKKVVSGSHYEVISVTANSSQLTIKHVALADDGYYECQANSNRMEPANGRSFVGVIEGTYKDDQGRKKYVEKNPSDRGVLNKKFWKTNELRKRDKVKQP